MQLDREDDMQPGRKNERSRSNCTVCHKDKPQKGRVFTSSSHGVEGRSPRVHLDATNALTAPSRRVSIRLDSTTRRRDEPRGWHPPKRKGSERDSAYLSVHSEVAGSIAACPTVSPAITAPTGHGASLGYTARSGQHVMACSTSSGS